MYLWMRKNKGKNRWYGWNGHPTLERMRQDRPITRTLITVRNPWDRVVSYYAMLQGIFNQSEFFQQHLIYKQWPEFKRFILDLHSVWPDNCDLKWITTDLSLSQSASYFFYVIQDSQLSWLSGEEPDLVLRQESMEKDFAQVQDMFGCSEPLPVENTSDHADYRSYYDAETRDIIACWHAADIERFNYDF